MPLFNIPLRDTIPTACPDCHELKTQFYVLGVKDLICINCATNTARDFEANFDAIFNASPSRPADPAPIPVNELKNGEFVRFTGHAKKPTIYEKIGYDRSTRRYMLQCVDDISRLRFIKGSTRVYPTDY